jgi:hypothetical protein
MDTNTLNEQMNEASLTHTFDWQQSLCLWLPAGFGSSHEQAAQAFDAHVAQGVAGQLARQACAPEPTPRTLHVPPPAAVASLMCPPEEVVLQQLHAKRSEVLQVCGAHVSNHMGIQSSKWG